MIVFVTPILFEVRVIHYIRNKTNLCPCTLSKVMSHCIRRGWHIFPILIEGFFNYVMNISKYSLTPTCFEHAAFWSGVRRATVAPRSQLNHKLTKLGRKQNEGSTEIWTRIAGFKVQSANHYTIEPWHMWEVKLVKVPNCNLCILKD